jgi:hypothetical protein
MVTFIFHCIDNNIPIRLVSKHAGNFMDELKEKRLYSLFDEIIHISPAENKFDHINDSKSIFIDDSFGDRKSVFDKLGVQVFDTHMIEFLMNLLAISSCNN